LVLLRVRRSFVFWSPALAQFAEPIFTRSAIPNPLGTGSLKMDFVETLGASTRSRSAAIPESLLEIGLGRGLEAALMLPLLRVSQPGGSSVPAGGQFSVALRYQLAGSADAKFAIAVAELKSGLSLGVLDTRRYTIPSQLAWFWGRRE